MKKRTKILSILLAIMLTATLVPTALVQVFASDYEWDDSATADEPGTGITVTSFEITKSPNVLSYYKDYPAGWELFDGMEVLITFSDGTSYSGAYDENLSEAVEEKGLDEIYESTNIIITTDLDNLPLGKNTITYEFCGYTDTQEITVSEKDPRAIVKIELTKLPDKVFSAPYFTGERPDNSDFEAFKSFFDNLDDNNSIAYNMDGAELTIYRANGEKEVFYKFSEHKPAMSLCGQSVYPDCGILSVTDLGNYKAHISYQDFHYLAEEPFEMDFTVNNTSTNDNPATPGEVITPSNPSSTVPTGSQGGTSSTSDTPANGNTNNGAVATGNAAVSAILLSVLLLAAGVMAVIGRKKQLF